MDGPAQPVQDGAEPPPPPFYGLFPRLGWAVDGDDDREGDGDLPARCPQPRLRIVA